MAEHEMPELPKILSDRMKLVRRDVGVLLFHFTRALENERVKEDYGEITKSCSAFRVLSNILEEGRLKGTSKWTYGDNCVCFTEAPITEFHSIFSLVSIAASKKERPRYEPYGIAVSKKWLFLRGGRPVIYDHPSAFNKYPEELRYRFVPYDPLSGIDYTWEREWRIKTDYLSLDPHNTLVIVPTADEAFQITYDFSDIEADWDVEGSQGEAYIAGTYHQARWLSVSLDIFGFSHLSKDI